ncbi:MAG: hypothetical protein RKE49_09680 [Oceanicaulis sp.]
MLALAAALSLSCSAPAAINDPVARVDAFLRGETRLGDLGVFALARDPSPDAQEAWARLETGLALLTMQAGPDAGPGCKWSRAEAQMVLARAVDGNCEISLEPGAMVLMEQTQLSVWVARQASYFPGSEGYYGRYFATAGNYRLGLEQMQAAYPDGITAAWYINEVGADWCGDRSTAFWSVESWVVDADGLVGEPLPEFVREAMSFPEATADFQIRAAAWLAEHDPD